jgi:E3 ubiquitin-protein ligase HERC2
MVFPQFLMKLYTWKELEYKVCGKPSIDLHHLRAISKYNGCTEDDETCKRFWRVLESFSDEEKSLYLKFVWGRSRLPLVDEKFGDKHTIKLISPANCDQSLPIAHTCFFAIDVPRYSTEEIMREKFLYAIKFCQAIDTDGSPYEILGEQSDEDF